MFISTVTLLTFATKTYFLNANCSRCSSKEGVKTILFEGVVLDEYLCVDENKYRPVCLPCYLGYMEDNVYEWEK